MTTILEIETTLYKVHRLKFLNDLADFLDEHLDNYIVRVKALNPIIVKKGKVLK